MRVAQRLYERGYITYMRTDSTTLSESALRPRAAGARHVRRRVRPRRRAATTRKVKNAQEAHEAIRPAGDRSARRRRCGRAARSDEFALYDLIWKRTVASQMADAAARPRPSGWGATCRDGRTVAPSSAPVRHGHHLPRLPRGVRGGPRRGGRPRKKEVNADEERRLPKSREGD
jgi:DNA topoisomerase-1